MFSPFYFSSIRKYVTLFGTLFNDLRITRTIDGEIKQLIRVPITYAPKEKMLARVTQDPNIDRPMAVMPIPAMSFEITGMSYDSSRKLNTLNRITRDSTDKTKGKYQYNPVAYNIDFSLSVYVKNAEDGAKIVEQILPYFTPDWTSTIHLIPEMNIKLDIPVILNDISMEDSYDGDFRTRRALIYTLTFTMKAYFYGPVKEKKIIKFANTEFFTPSVPDGELYKAVGTIDPVVVIHTQPGLTANGEPTSNASLSIPVADIIATDDFGFVIDITEYDNG